jgi:cytidine deaminase
LKKLDISIVLDVYDSVETLPVTIQELMQSAKQARDRAYAPYSSFMVGSSIELANGVIVQGNNQENAAYPSGLCAERVAVFYAGATYPGVAIKNIAITVRPCTIRCLSQHLLAAHVDRHWQSMRLIKMSQ